MAAGDVVKVRTRGHVLGQSCEFGVHIRYKTATADASDLAASWVATIMPLVIAATGIECNWEMITVADTSPTGSESVNLGLTQPNPGTVIGDALPPQNAIVVGLRTGVKGGRRRGRFYLPGVTENYQDDGRLMGAQLTAAQALAQGLINAYGPSGSEPDYELVVYSPEVLEFPPPKPKKPRPGRLISLVQTAQVDSVIRTQRRRSIGVGA